MHYPPNSMINPPGFISNNDMHDKLNSGEHINGVMMTNGRFMITKSIGKGSFGEIFQGQDTLTGKDVAIKMEHKHCKVKVLAGEAKVLKQLQGLEGFPKMHWFGQEHSQNVLVMDLLGPSLSTLFKQNGSKFSLPSVLKLADQILQRIESMHSAGFIHRDIKPNNFVMGLPGTPNQNQLYLIDFGLSKPYKDLKRGVHFPQLPPGRSLTGTARYASVNSHQGFTLSRRDDLESIAYMLIQFLRGNLPWQGIGGANKLEKYSNILEIKMQTVEEILCKDIPEQFCKFLKYSKELEYDEKPDYKRLRHEFRVLFMDIVNPYEDFLFDWQNKRQKSVKKPLQITISPLNQNVNEQNVEVVNHYQSVHVGAMQAATGNFPIDLVSGSNLGTSGNRNKNRRANSNQAMNTNNNNNNNSNTNNRIQQQNNEQALHHQGNHPQPERIVSINHSEEEVKLILLNHNYEGFKDKQGEDIDQPAPMNLEPSQQQSQPQQVNQQQHQSQNFGLPQIPDEFENDPFYLQKQIGDDCSANRIRSQEINLTSFTLNPNQRITHRALFLSVKQEQARLNRLKQLYGGTSFCPDFLFSKDRVKDSDSLCSMEPLVLQLNQNGQVENLESIHNRNLKASNMSILQNIKKK